MRLIAAIEAVASSPTFLPYATYYNFGQDLGYTKFISLIKDGTDYLSLSSDKDYMVTYCRKPEDRLSPTNRVKTTFGKYIHGIYKAELPYQIFFISKVWEFISKFDFRSNIKILKGKELTKFYNDTTNIKSCLTGPAAWRTIFYAKNPSKVQLVTLDDEVRALLWTMDDKKKVLDYIYPSGHWKIPLLTSWAKKKGYLLVNELYPNKPSCTMKIVKNKLGKHIFPFIDSFHYGKVTDDKINLMTQSTIDHPVVYGAGDIDFFPEDHR